MNKQRTIEQLTTKIYREMKESKQEHVTREHYAQLREQITREFGEQVLNELEQSVSQFISWHFGKMDDEGLRLHYLRSEYLSYWRKAYNVKRTKRVKKLDKKTRKQIDKYAINKMRMRSKTRRHYNELCKTIANEFGLKVLVDLQTKAFIFALNQVMRIFPKKNFRQCNWVIDMDFQFRLRYMREVICDFRMNNKNYNINTKINDNYTNCMMIDK